MKKPIILSLLFFILTAIPSFGQGGQDPVTDILAEEISKNRLLLDSLARRLQPILKPEFLLSYIENGERFGITPEQAAAITANTTKIDALISDVATQFETLGKNDTDIGKQLTALGHNDTAIGEQITKLGQNDESMMAEINAMKAQLQTLVASVAEKDAQIVEKDAKIAELEQGGEGQSLEQVLEQVRDARAGSVVLTVDPDGDNITLGLTIEQTDNLIEWTKLDGEMTRTVPIPEGKKFYRFALDK